MFQTIVFDLGGVMVDFSPRVFLVDHFMNEELESKLFDLTFGSEEWAELDAGLITRAEANARMRKKGEAIGRSFEVGTILTDWADMLRTKEDTVRLARRLKKAGFRILYLSNISQDVFALLRQRKFWNVFDGGVASCEVHVNKPEPDIYLALLERYHLEASSCVFLDDNPLNVETANSLGFHGLRFHSAALTARDLESCGVFGKK